MSDVTSAARFLCHTGRGDARRLIIRGGSAGGYTTLAALTFQAGTFKAGASYYGISDLEVLELDSHKFESRYSHSLIGPYAARMGVVAGYASAAQEALDDQLERAEYALIDEEEELINARTRAASARTAWLQAVAQHQASATLRDDARQSLWRERETTLEREDPPLRSAS